MLVCVEVIALSQIDCAGALRISQVVDAKRSPYNSQRLIQLAASVMPVGNVELLLLT